MLVGRRDVQHGHVHRGAAAGKKPGHVRQEDRHVGGTSFGDRVPGVRADEERTVEEVAGLLRLSVRGGAVRVQMDDLDIGQLRPPGDQRVDEHVRGGAGALGEDPLTGLDAADRLCGGDPADPPLPVHLASLARPMPGASASQGGPLPWHAGPHTLDCRDDEARLCLGGIRGAGRVAVTVRMVRGRTDRVVVVGAGLSGLAAALHLAGAGREVTVLERERGPGGRCGLLERDGFRFDTGPTVLTMPELLERPFAAVGERLSDRVELVPVRPLYRARFADGSGLDVHADPDAMAAEIERLCGPREVAGYLAFRRFVTGLYQVEMPHFIDRNVDGPLGLAGTPMLRLLALGGFRRLAGKVAGYLRDPRLQRVFSFQAMYAGLAPHRALALYAVIAYMDAVAGVYFPRGGMHAVPMAMAAAAGRHGVAFRYRCEATRVHVRGGRAVGVSTGDGQHFPADAVVLTPDLPIAYRTLLPAGTAPRRLRRLRYSPSCFLLLAGSRAGYPHDAHHTITFGQAWEQTFRELIGAGALMSDPSFLVTCRPAATRRWPRPAGTATTSCSPPPTPKPGWTGRCWGRATATRWSRRCRSAATRASAPASTSSTPSPRTTGSAWAWTAALLSAAAHTFGQTGPFRPANVAPGLDNVVFAGSGTVPGVGIPMVLVSGRLAAQRVTGERAAG